MPSVNDSLMLPAFLGYAAPGAVKDADLVFASYGNEEDFVELEKWKISCSGRIVIMRYGKIFRGNKVSRTELSQLHAQSFIVQDGSLSSKTTTAKGTFIS